MIEWFNGFIIGFVLAMILILIPLGFFAHYMDKNFKYVKRKGGKNNEKKI